MFQTYTGKVISWQRRVRRGIVDLRLKLELETGEKVYYFIQHIDRDTDNPFIDWNERDSNNLPKLKIKAGDKVIVKGKIVNWGAAKELVGILVC